jgi:outer membrane protein assembly factor BamB
MSIRPLPLRLPLPLCLLGILWPLGVLQALAVQKPAVPSGAAADWPVFRGNLAQTGFVPQALPEPLHILWKFQAKGAFEATAAIAHGRVFAATEDDEGALYALRLEDGKLLWQQKLGPIKASPSVFRDAVYVGTEDGIFFCLDAQHGTPRWRFETGAEITGGANFAQGNILIGSYDSFLYCLTPAGKLLWKLKTEGPINGAPTVHAGYTFVAGCDSQLRVIATDRGRQVRAVDLEGQVGATPAVLGDCLYVGTMTDQVKAIDWQKGKVLWTYEPARRGQGFYSSPAVTNTVVVLGGRNRQLHALERQSGKLLWTYTAKGKIDASPVIAGQRVYAPCHDGHLYVLDLTSGKEIQRLALGQAIAASPAVAQGRLVLGTVDGTLYCLGQRSP